MRKNLITLIPATKYGKITLAAILLQALIVITLQSILAAIFMKYYASFGGNSSLATNKGIPVYLVIFILAQVFAIILSWDALHHKNTIQIFGFALFNLMSFFYSIFQNIQMRILLDKPFVLPFLLEGKNLNNIDSTDKFIQQVVLYLIPIILGLFQILFGFLSFKLYLEFGWKIYKKIGADPKMRNMYRFYQVFLMLLKMDAFFVISFGVQFLVLVIDSSDPEFALTICALPILIIILALVVYGVRREDKIIMWLFSFSVILAVAYFLFKVIRINMPNADGRPNQYSDTKNYLTLFSVLSLLVVGSTLVISAVCYRNFGQGLKQYVLRDKSLTEESGENTQQQLTTTMDVRKPVES